MERCRLIDSLGATVERTLRPLVAGRPKDGVVALLDFPAHSNVGDSAIWLGELACLRALGVRRIRYSCDILTYDRAQLARRIGPGPILLHGGGNVGDLYERHQQLREAVIRAFPDNPIVQLPQSIHFRSRDALERARTVFDAHPDLTLLVRERRSLEMARSEFRARSQLCPDMAFCLGPLERPAPACRPLLWLARTDVEAARDAGGGWPEASPDLRVDWLRDPPMALAAVSRRLGGWLARHPGLGPVLRDALSATYAPLARRRLERGCRLLASAGAIVTDRLHGHVLCLLLGIPHVLLDNNYGKVRSFYETWTADADLVRWGESPAEALRLARAW